MHDLIGMRHEQQRRSYQALNTRQDAERSTAVVLTICTALGGLAAVGATIVAIAAVSGTAIRPLSAVAALVVGIAMVLHGTGISVRAKRRYHHAGDRAQIFGLIGGAACEIVGGAGGIVLGLAALAGFAPSIVLPVAVIVIGGAAVLVAPAQYTAGWLALRRPGRLDRVAYVATGVSAWALVFAGLAALTLGALALMSVGEGHEMVYSAASLIALGVAVYSAAGALAVRFGVQLDAEQERDVDVYAARLVDLMSARLEAARLGRDLYLAVIAKVQARDERTFDLLIPALETFADKELENTTYLETQVQGLGGDIDTPSPLAEIESRATSGVEEIVIDSAETDPVHLLYALHAADMADAAGWKLLEQVVDEIGHHELKKEVTTRHGDKAEQVRFLERVLERLTRHAYVGEPIDSPLSAYN